MENILMYIKKIKLYVTHLLMYVIRKLKRITKQDIRKYLPLVVSCFLIVAVFFTTVFLPNRENVKKKPFDVFSSLQIVESIKNLELNLTSVIYMLNNEGEWVEYRRVHGDENRIWVSLEKIPETLQNAFIAIEDERFEKHHGVDWKRTFLAVVNQVFKYSDSQFGGSTITQQLIKNVTSDKGKNYTRKIREIVRALFIETKLEKDEILEAYLNTIALGNGICGVEVAANYYFNKKVSELSLVECAAIAAITKNPSRYNPVRNMEENKKRRNLVIKNMLQQGFISESEYKEAYDKEIELDFSKKEMLDSEINSYFVDTLIEQVITDFSKKYDCSEEIASQMFYNGGFRIYSTVNYDVQTAMEKVYSQENRYFYETRKNEAGETERVQSAMTVMDYNGHIVGIVGGAGEKTVNRGLNRAYDVPRQPGSTMKPLGVYALALENDIVNYTSTVKDEPIDNYYGKGKPGPKEWYGEYLGEVPLNYALRRSMNTVPVRLLEKVGFEESYKFLTKKLNLKHLVKADKNASSLALGGCTYGITPTESAAAFSIFGNGGVYYKPTTYYRIEKTNGEIVLENNTKGKRAISENTATIMNRMLQEVVYGSGGTGGSISGFNYGMRAYAKTGTTSDTKDAWLVGGTPYYVGSVWYGFDHNYRVYNINAAKNIWRDVMREVHKDLDKKEFEYSEDVRRIGIGYYKDGTWPKNVLKEDFVPKEKEEDKEKDQDKKDKDDKKDKENKEDKKEPIKDTSSKEESSEDTSSNEESSTDISSNETDTDKAESDATTSDNSSSEEQKQEDIVSNDTDSQEQITSSETTQTTTEIVSQAQE